MGCIHSTGGGMKTRGGPGTGPGGPDPGGPPTTPEPPLHPDIMHLAEVSDTCTVFILPFSLSLPLMFFLWVFANTFAYDEHVLFRSIRCSHSHIVYCILYIKYYMLYTMYKILYVVYYILYIVYYILNIVYYILNIQDCLRKLEYCDEVLYFL